MAKSLELLFNTSLGKAKSLSVADPILNLTPENAKAAMESISALKLFQSEGVDLYATVVGARYTERIVEDIFEA
ncbi:Protein of unknown function [Carnobacterium iners]|uniref:DUF2922 domain-containing protein n=1 Tax=Carnobacterium iners TaxID=1073423 RepID=A0A1X7N9T6_9LACT|nr:DUF2922 domain-containing protein [Carnobacterium iners]SEK50544.1 Protein of unknown function [Carnobacterium iners]SMH34330.1 Protein of unknown function [Carnobacterium iners]